MRGLLAILILVNGVVFYWFSSQATPQAEPPEVVAGYPKLMLLSERLVDEVLPLPDKADCLVVGPVVELGLIDRLSERLAEMDIGHERWPEAAPSDYFEADLAADESSEKVLPVAFYWLQLGVSQRQRLGEQFWLDIRAASPITKILEKSCTTVASPTDFP